MADSRFACVDMTKAQICIHLHIIGGRTQREGEEERRRGGREVVNSQQSTHHQARTTKSPLRHRRGLHVNNMLSCVANTSFRLAFPLSVPPQRVNRLMLPLGLVSFVSCLLWHNCNLFAFAAKSPIDSCPIQSPTHFRAPPHFPLQKPEFIACPLVSGRKLLSAQCALLTKVRSSSAKGNKYQKHPGGKYLL